MSDDHANCDVCRAREAVRKQQQREAAHKKWVADCLRALAAKLDVTLPEEPK